MNKKWLFFFLQIVIFPVLTQGQAYDKFDNGFRIFDQSGHKKLLQGEGFHVFGDNLPDLTETDQNDDIRVIVQFETPPLATMTVPGSRFRDQKSGLKKLGIELEHQTFIVDLREIENGRAKTGQPDLIPSKSEVHFQYQVAYNGMALTTKEWVVSEILSLPYVKSVQQDKTVHAHLDYSIQVIGADKVWDTHGLSGEGIVVGILDSGIDYSHPDLGGGFGEGFKVIGGYDFVNNDTDPMDDNGHGTHVAGIVAADGLVRGVAPGASLMAYKVLNSGGWGHDSWVLAGIEQAVIDGVDILNVSLGGPDYEDNTLVEGITNATIAGILCVVSAGNDGPKYESVASPGIAKSALTVGNAHCASYALTVASSSSKGPVGPDMIVKPELLAPGVGIHAPVLNGNYASYTGTSMAAPHVAGAAALLLEKDPNLSPDYIKSLFVQTARDLGHDIFAQGSGLIDLVRASELPDITTQPPLISLGEVAPNEEIWLSSATITVYNNNPGESKPVSLSTQGSFLAGASLTMDPADFTLQPGSSQAVELTLEVNNNQLAFPEGEFISYSEKILITSGNKETVVPVALIKSRKLKLQMDEVPLFVYINGVDVNHVSVIQHPEPEISLRLPKGYYNILVQYTDGKSLVINEDVEVQGHTILEINREQAKNRIESINYDKYGSIITPSARMEDYIIGNGVLGMGCWDISQSVRYISDFSKTNRLWFGPAYLPDATNVYLLGDYMESCSSDLIQTYDPENLVHLKFSYPYLEEKLYVYPSVIFKYYSGHTDDSFVAMSHWNASDSPYQYPFEQDFHVSPNYQHKNLRSSFFNVICEYTGEGFSPSPSNVIFETPRYIVTDEGNLMAYRTYYNRKENSFFFRRFPVDVTEIKIGMGPPVWSGMIWLENERIVIDNYNYLFLSQMKDYRSVDNIPYRLYNGGQLEKQGNLLDDLVLKYYKYSSRQFGQIFLDPGAYALEVILEQFPVQDQQGTAKAKIAFDTSTSSGYAPGLISLEVLSNGEHTDRLVSGAENLIRFEVLEQETGVIPAIVRLDYRGEGEDWAELQLENNDYVFYSDISSDIPTGYVSLRITIEDHSGNSLIYTVEPAFLNTILPDISTIHVTEIQSFSAKSGGTIHSDGGNPVISRGIVWSKSENPTLETHDGITQDGAGTGEFTSMASGLDPLTTYFVRAYATNIHGTSYGNLHQFSTLEFPDVRTLANRTIVSSEETCFDAQQIITTGGDGPFAVESGAVVSLIAGENIIMLPGTRLKSGSYVHAYIAPGGPFCGEPDKQMLAAEAEQSEVPSDSEGFYDKAEAETKFEAEVEKLFRVYPNPTTGRFTLEIHTAGQTGNALVEVYGLRGERVLREELPGDLHQHELSLEGQLPGLYIVRVMSGQDVGVERIIKR